MRFADDIDLLGGSEEELQQLTERLENIAAGSGMEINSDKSNILVKQHQAKTMYQHMDALENAERSEPVQIPRIHTNQRRNTNK